MAAYIGIDLGTTFSAVATIDDTGRPVIIHNGEGDNVTPSCVWFDDSKEEDNEKLVVGEEARKIWGIAPDTAAARFKRDMGSSTTHIIDGQEYTPTELSTLVLNKIVTDAAKTIGPIGEAVVTIPANFSNEAREATMAAAANAGLNVKYIINEPTAAALYYAFKNGEDLGGIYAVYDLGGGTFDVSIIRVDGQDVEVIASNGVSKLGGDDFDRALVKLVQEKFRDLTGEELDPEDFTINDAEEQKQSLSARDTVLFRTARKNIKITRAEFEEVISSFVSQAEMLCEATLEEAEVNFDDIEEVFLAGGSTRVPAVKRSVENVFRKEPTASVNVDEVVALGAALYAALMGDRENLSATQAKAIEKIKVTEATGKCFGFLALSRANPGEYVNTIIISKNEKIPCLACHLFYTANEGQEAVACTVTECTAPETDPRFANTIWDGRLELPPGRPAAQKISVTFSYDENQIMHCSFVDVATKRETKIELSMTASSNEDTGNIDRFLLE